MCSSADISTCGVFTLLPLRVYGFRGGAFGFPPLWMYGGLPYAVF